MGPKVVACNMRSSDVKVMPQKENSGGGGGDITVDSELSLSSENPVQNKVITEALGNKRDVFTVIVNWSSDTGVYSCNKTYTEIMNAITQNKCIIALCTVDNYTETAEDYDYYSCVSKNRSFESVTFSEVNTETDSVAGTSHIYVNYITIDINNNIYVDVKEL